MSILALLPLIGDVLDRVLPDPQATADAKLKAFELAQNGQFAELEAAVKLSVAQTDVNKAEASSEDAFTRRWRPAIGYVIVAALAFQYVVNPLLAWAVVLLELKVTPPAIKMDEHLWELIIGMLGLAGWRSLDKRKNR